MKSGRILLSCAAVVLALTSFFPVFAQEGGWQQNWGVPEGFVIELDSEGFDNPTSIAFVPNPGPNPKDPLYFVAELRGSVKVVTNDRSIYSFADNLIMEDQDRGLAAPIDEFGMGGICLAPEQGYVFVTFTYRRDEQLYNNILRFETRPLTFSIEPEASEDFFQLFSDFPTSYSHQIGNCQVAGDMLYVSVADGMSDELPLGLETPLGKVLRLTLNGQGFPDNPFYDPSNPQKPASLVWAFGFRNPFGLKILDGRVFVADNGVRLDRFIETSKGEDYLWNGFDTSIGARALVAFFPPIGPAQMDFADTDYTAFPRGYRSAFFIASSVRKSPGVVELPFDLLAGRASAPPTMFVEYLGPDEGRLTGAVAAIGLGRDGLYFAPLIPDVGELSAVYKVSYAEGEANSVDPVDMRSAPVILETYGCLGCHSLEGEGGAQAPSLDYTQLLASIETRLNWEGYSEALDALDRIEEEPFVSTRDARQEIRDLNGFDQVRAWLVNRILVPKFDNPDAVMPQFGLQRRQAEILADYLLSEAFITPGATEAVVAQEEEESQTQDQEAPQGPEQETLQTLLARLPKARYRHIAIAFVLGIGLGLGSPWLFQRYGNQFEVSYKRFRKRISRVQRVSKKK